MLQGGCDAMLSGRYYFVCPISASREMLLLLSAGPLRRNLRTLASVGMLANTRLVHARCHGDGHGRSAEATGECSRS